ncbi:MAG: PKD domain-containing protein [Bacteroidetes bacterium]|nr:PKD domain-containing protein [Bacteroidota bacterium]
MRKTFQILVLCWLFMFSAKVEATTGVFIPNKGQWNGDFIYKSHVAGGIVYLEKTGFTISMYNNEQMKAFHDHTATEMKLDGHAIKVSLVGCNPEPEIVEEKHLETIYNYYLGSEKNWATNLRACRQVTYKNVYPNIDFRLKWAGEMLKYEFLVHPGGDDNIIKLEYDGATEMELMNGNLNIQTSIRPILEESPYSYQKNNGSEKEVSSSFLLRGNQLSFQLEAYNSEQDLIIDPAIIFSTFSGSYADNFGYTATFDRFGHGYSGGTVYYDQFPVTAGAFQQKWAGGDNLSLDPNASNFIDLPRDMGILKYSGDGTKLLYATYLGGSSNEDVHSMIVNSKNELLLLGNTFSNDFPVTTAAYDTSQNGQFDIVVSKLSFDGTKLLASTYLGGSGFDGINGYHLLTNRGFRNTSVLAFNYADIYRGEVIIDSFDNVLIVSSTASTDLPVDTNSFQQYLADTSSGSEENQDMLVAKFSADLSALHGITYFGGYGDDAGYGIAIGKNQSIFICGGTRSDSIAGFPSNGLQPKYAGHAADGLIACFDKDLHTLKSATYFGQPGYDQTHFIQADTAGDVYVTGQTRSSNFLVKNTKFSEQGGKMFISKLDSSLTTCIWSSTYGPSTSWPGLSPSAFLVDHCGRIYVSGWGGNVNYNGNTYNFTTSKDAIQKTTDGSDFYLAVFARNMDTLLYATYFGGSTSWEHVDGGTSRFDQNGIVYQSVCAGCGGYSDFPTTQNAYSSVNNGTRPPDTTFYDSTGCNNALFKIDLYTPDVVADFELQTPCAGQSFQVKNECVNATSFFWKFGDGNNSTDRSPIHTYSKPGTYTVSLVASNPYSCVVKDTVFKQMVVVEPANAAFVYELDTCTKSVTFKYSGTNGISYNWNFDNGTYASGAEVTKKYDSTGAYAVRLVVDSGFPCPDTIFKIFSIPEYKLGFSSLFDSCNFEIQLTNNSVNAKNITWLFNNNEIKGNQVLLSGNEGANTYKLVGSAGQGCADTLTETINFNPNPIAAFGYLTDSCSTKSIFNNASQNAGHYVWDFGNNNISRDENTKFVYGDTGIYNVKLIANPNSQCADTVEQQLHIRTARFPEFTTQTNHCDFSVALFDQSRNVETYFWRFGDGDSSLVKDPKSHRYSAPGKYTISLFSDIGKSICQDTYQLDIEIDSLPKAIINTKTGDCVSHVEYESQSRGYQKLTWYFPDGSTATGETAEKIYKVIDSVKVWLVAESEHGCLDSTLAINYVDSIVEAEFSFKFDTCAPAVLFKNQSAGTFSYNWYHDGDSLSNERNPVLPINYNLKDSGAILLVVNQYSKCRDSLLKRFLFDYSPKDSFWAPNVITPNQDGLNDVWIATGTDDKCGGYELIIFNRWGQPVHKQTGFELKWDGTTPNGTEVARGTYFYIITSPNSSRHGTITITD